jgi:hypothetical protein
MVDYSKMNPDSYAILRNRIREKRSNGEKLTPEEEAFLRHDRSVRG